MTLFRGNVVSGLGGTRSLSIPMFTALRRFSILMTMLGEYVVLDKEPSLQVILSVCGMVSGALVAAAFDLAFDAYGYGLVFTNNFFTALSGVYLKKASATSSCGKTGVLFYNSLFSLLALLLFYGAEHTLLVFNSEAFARPSALAKDLPADSASDSSIMRVLRLEAWRDPSFLALFVCCSLMGSVLNYSIFLCTTYNSALTTAVVGCLKNVLSTYLGMVLFSGYAFSWLNFAGINLSTVASLYYTYVTLK